MREISVNDLVRTILCDQRGCALDAEIGSTRCREHLHAPRKTLEEVAAVANPGPQIGAAVDPPAPVRTATSSSAYKPRPGSRASRILELLADGPKQFGAIGRTLAMDEKRVASTLWGLVHVGAVVRVSRGVYALPAVSEREPQAEEARDRAAVAHEPTASTSAVTAARTPSRSETAVRDTFTVMRNYIDRLERELLDELYRDAA